MSFVQEIGAMDEEPGEESPGAPATPPTLTGQEESEDSASDEAPPIEPTGNGSLGPP